MPTPLPTPPTLLSWNCKILLNLHGISPVMPCYRTCTSRCGNSNRCSRDFCFKNLPCHKHINHIHLRILVRNYDHCKLLNLVSAEWTCRCGWVKIWTTLTSCLLHIHLFMDCSISGEWNLRFFCWTRSRRLWECQQSLHISHEIFWHKTHDHWLCTVTLLILWAY